MIQFSTDVFAVPEAISSLTERLMAFLEGQGVDMRATHHVALIVEELLTNLGTHGQCCDCRARVTITVAADAVTGEIVDGGASFDPRMAPAPDLDLDALDRPAGGLGLFLVRELSCDLHYVRHHNENHTSFAVARA
jgi:anti-sigma regulatory factor (Ser/Thr protein kinase)